MHPNTPRTPRFSDRFIITTFVVVGVALLAAVASGPAAVFVFLGVLALALLALGVLALGGRGVPSFFVTTRRRAGLVLGVGLVASTVALGGLGVATPPVDRPAAGERETDGDIRRAADLPADPESASAPTTEPRA